MSFTPQFRLYAADGTTLIYTFTYVQNITDFQDPAKFVEHESLRGQGSIIIPGSDAAYDLTIQFILQGVDYSDLVSKINTLKSTITKFTKYVLKVDLTISTTQDYKVMRLNPISFPIESNTNKRVTLQRVEMTLRVNTWA